MDGFIKLPRARFPDFEEIEGLVLDNIAPQTIRLWYFTPANESKLFDLLLFIAEFNQKKNAFLLPGESCRSHRTLSIWLSFFDRENHKWKKPPRTTLIRWIGNLVTWGYIYKRERQKKQKETNILGVYKFLENYSGSNTKEVCPHTPWTSLGHPSDILRNGAVEGVGSQPLGHTPKNTPKNSPKKGIIERDRGSGGKGKNEWTNPPEIKDFPLSKNLTDWGIKEGVNKQDFLRHIESCFDWHKANGKKKKDWEATIRNWIRREKSFNKKPNYQKPISAIELERQRLNQEETTIEVTNYEFTSD